MLLLYPIEDRNARENRRGRKVGATRPACGDCNRGHPGPGGSLVSLERVRSIMSVRSIPDAWFCGKERGRMICSRLRRALLAAALGMGVTAGLARADGPPLAPS